MPRSRRTTTPASAGPVLNGVALDSARSSFLRRHLRTLVASLALAGGFAWVLNEGALPLLPPEGTLDQVDWMLVLVGTLVLLVSIVARLVRYHFLIAPLASISIVRTFVTLCLSLGLLTFLPFRLGEMARPALLREKGKLSGWAVTGTVGAERIIDGVVFGIMLLAGLAFAKPHEPLPERIGNLPVPAALVPGAALVASLGFGAAFLAMAAFFLFRATARRITERLLGIVSARLAKAVADAVERVSEGLSFLPSFRYMGSFLLLTAVGAVTNIVSLQLLARAVGLSELSFAQTTVVLGVLALGFALPNAPGFFGAIQLALYAGLAVYLPPARVVREGAAFVFIFYAAYIGLVILVTLFGLVGEYAVSHRVASPRASTPP